MRTLILSGVIALAVSGCAGMSDRDQRILSGAAIGGVAGNVIGGGSTGATVGGAVLGGVVGAGVDNDAKARTRDDWNRRYNDCLRYYTRRYCSENVH